MDGDDHAVMMRLRLLTILGFALCFSHASHAATPTQLQHQGCPSGSTAYTTYVCPLSEVTQASNWVICAIQYGNNASVTATVSDDNSDTWTTDKKFADSNQDYVIGHLVATAGARVLTLNFAGANGTFVQWGCAEYNNIASLDLCSAGAQATSATVTAGSLTPTVTGDLLIDIGGNESGGTPDAWTKGSQANITWAFQQSDPGYNTTNMVAQAIQWGVYASTSAINSTMTLASSVTQGSVACAYKQGSAGSARPAGRYLSSLEHYNIPTASTGVKLALPADATNNFLYLGCINSTAGGAAPFLTAVSGSTSGTWTEIGHAADSGGSGWMMLWYKANASTGVDDVLTLTINTGNTFAEAECIAYGGNGYATAPLDTTLSSSNGSCSAGLCTLTGNQASGGNLSTITLTPTSSNGTMICQVGVNSPQIRGVTSGLSDVAFSAQEASINELDENNGRMHNNYSSTSAFTVVWTTGGSAVSGWQAACAAFNTPSTATPTVNKRRKLERMDDAALTNNVVSGQ